MIEITVGLCESFRTIGVDISEADLRKFEQALYEHGLNVAPRAEPNEIDRLRKALYELLHVSFPPSGADVPELVAAHHKAVSDGCALLGINPNPIVR